MEREDMQDSGGGNDRSFFVFSSIVKVNATHLFFEDAFGRGVAFSLTKRCV